MSKLHLSTQYEVRFRNGDRYVYDDDADYLRMKPLKDIAPENYDRLEWIIECHDMSAQIAPMFNPISLVTEIVPTSCDAGQVTVDMPHVPGGTYYLRLRNSQLGYLQEKLDIAYELAISYSV